MASTRMKADEKRAKILRQLIALESNKYCFDCSQRGTTYVNMTIGSYVCTQCSGLLRGLNNPHRVKSVNIATFTNDDMDFLKSRGNDLCRKVWLGLYDRNSSVPEPDPKNSQGLKDFLSMKYDSKRWHVAPTDDFYNEARQTNQPAFDQVERSNNRSSRGIIPNNNSSKLIIQQPPRSNPASATSSVTSMSSVGGTGNKPASTGVPAMQKIDASAFITASGPTQPGPEPSGRTGNLLGDLGADPFGAPAPAPATSTATAPGAFPADFSAAFNSAPSPATSSPWGMTSHTPLVPSQPGGAAPMAPPLGPSPSGVAAAPLGPAPATGNASDKYAALAELDGLFGSGPTQPGAGTPVSVFGPPPSQPPPAPTSVNWSGQAQTVGGGGGGGSGGFGMAWSGGAPTTGATAAWNPAGGEPSASIFGGAGATSGGSGSVFGATSTWSNGNPFGAGAGPAASAAAAPNKMGGPAPSANPFMGNPFAAGAAPGAATGSGGGWPGMNHHNAPPQQPQHQSPSGAQPALNGWGSMGQPMMMAQPQSQPVSHNPFLSLSNQFQSGPAAPPQQSQPFGSAAPSSTNPFL